MTAVTVDVVDLTKRYGTRTALDGVNFSARAGDVVGLLGANGAGKTTAIRLLTTVLAPTSGTFSIAGRPWTAAAEIRRNVGVLPESSGYPAHQTGEEYLRYHARLFGMSRLTAQAETNAVLADVGLAERAGSLIATYSRGMRQRLGIARALVNRPAVVFLDEPTLGLDPAGQLQVLGIVSDIARRRGATVILSTHTLPEVEQVCSAVLILDRGRVLASGSVREVIATAAVERTAQLRVPIDLVSQASRALIQLPDLAFEPVDGRDGVLQLSVTSGSGLSAAESSAVLNAALSAVALAAVPVLSFELHGARLSDAFLQMTRRSAA